MNATTDIAADLERNRRARETFLTRRELAARWKVHINTVRRMEGEGEGDLIVTRIGRTIRYRLSHILELENKPQKGDSNEG